MVVLKFEFKTSKSYFSVTHSRDVTSCLYIPVVDIVFSY